MRSQRKIFAVMLSLSLMTAGAGLTSVTENHLFSENSLTVHAADGYVDFDEATGTLTLHGNITSDYIEDVPCIEYSVDGYALIYKDNRDVRKIIAAPGTVLPKDCSGLFACYSQYRTLYYDQIYKNCIGSNYCYYQRWPNLKSIDLSAANMSNVTNMSSMFSGCSSLTSINMNGADTANVTDMSEMFKDCSSLQSLNVSGFNTYKAEKMNSMFKNCSGLSTLDLNNFNTYYVKDMSGMFAGCSNLKSLKISGFDTHNVTGMSDMFNGCYNLENIASNLFNTSLLTSADSMFNGCRKIEKLDLSAFDTKNLKSAAKMFYDCPQLKTVIVSDLWDISKLSSDAAKEMFKYCRNIKGERNTGYNENYTDGTYARIDKAGAPGYFTHTEGTTDGYVYLNEDTGELALYGHVTKDMIDEYKSNNKVKSVTAAKGCILPSNCSNMFNRYSNNYWKNVSRIDLTNADASNVKNTSYMFNSIPASYIDISKLNFSKVENMSGMFYGCSSSKFIDVTNINTSNATDMSLMFSNCSLLSSIDCSSFNTSNVTNMNNMFSSCSSLSSIDCSSFDTSNVTTMCGMFKNCLNISSVNLSIFDTSCLTNIYNSNFAHQK